MSYGMGDSNPVGQTNRVAQANSGRSPTKKTVTDSGVQQPSGDVRAALFRDSTACLLAEEGARKGQLKEVGTGYTFFWSGRPKAERRDAGVAFAIRNDIVGRLPCLPHGINDRLMSLRLSLREDMFANIISAYDSQ
ncbi:unnamed protein product [Schistocephalus solidus]|uniref:Uncharacterized protein n=1 Tax=Schistocephalus solidus TaxID=70667 RepID=A0A183TQS5_SCHSO|nr:unnamed protein product [Schistocephalus solidus]